MPTLYYCPLACSMASHVALEEAGATFETQKINIFRGEHLTPEYRAINPRAKVPALRFDDGRVLLESTAILGWVGDNFPEAKLLGDDDLDRARTIATCAWLSSTVHPAFARFVHPERFLEDASGYADLKALGRANFWDYLQEIDKMLAGQPWIMGESFTVADPYALVFYPWGKELGLPVHELENYTTLKDRVIERPAARRALEREKSVLLTM
ncbi:glutathione S-transferase N-terminal domain-containing protein [Sphingomonas sp. CGMCC 1.13654]|uniref:Glutathione S-transferase N-terminal domain-containing protein n=1 Tax=Sphingomonas chungangi TaxID=2683589 RepID=A0A838LAY1_9SPHN|nr:glutathione S-transferase N-terminal domain-containing protein [Sphingomonas chungangi]MBA2935749.1 glutathione S-transferase N-terminal domain-containing protein [Sphingomonas chungangi]MVW54440.1 glutathione S-transferase [Sphingomonas chungangi]